MTSALLFSVTNESTKQLVLFTSSQNSQKISHRTKICKNEGKEKKEMINECLENTFSVCKTSILIGQAEEGEIAGEKEK